MLEGILRTGDRAKVLSAYNYRRPEGDVGVFYGLAGRLTEAFRDYPHMGRAAVYADLGYWGRKDGGRFAGYHKLSVNSRHPTAYFQRVRHPGDRAAAFGLKPAPWRKSGDHILLAGMGPKGSAAEGFKALAWETATAALLGRHTSRPIHYRPKPNWNASPRIAGAVLADRLAPLPAALQRAHAIVTHHSNAAIEAITAGVPAFVVEGAALPMALTDFTKIEQPYMPAGRQQWLNDLAYTQFSIAEMAAGVAWRHLKDEGLVP